MNNYVRYLENIKSKIVQEKYIILSNFNDEEKIKAKEKFINRKKKIEEKYNEKEANKMKEENKNKNKNVNIILNNDKFKLIEKYYNNNFFNKLWFY